MTASREPEDCVTCGRGAVGDNPCRCSNVKRVGKKPDADFWDALAKRPEKCTCDYPAIPFHRADCKVFDQPHVSKPKVEPISDEDAMAMMAFILKLRKQTAEREAVGQPENAGTQDANNAS